MPVFAARRRAEKRLLKNRDETQDVVLSTEYSVLSTGH